VALPYDYLTGLIVLVLSVVSLTIGNSVVLFANRVSRSQFIRSIFAFTFLFIFSIFLWTLSIQFFAAVFFGKQKPIVDVMLLVAASFTPFLFGFLILLPHFGYYLYALLRIWVTVNLVFNVMVAYEFNILQAALVSLLGWLLLELLSSVSFLRIEDIKRWFLRVTTGKGEYKDPDDLVMEYVRKQRQLALEAAQHRQMKAEAAGDD
jgi:signal transduction histidine kinase